MPQIFDTFELNDLKLRNRIIMPPMCQYMVEARDGIATDWHFVHYVSRAIGGTGLIILEKTGVEPDGRITDRDLGLWSDEQIEPLQRIVDACHSYGAKVGIQIGHAGRKAENAIDPVAPSPIEFSDKYRTPRELTPTEVSGIIDDFEGAFSRAIEAGMDTIEIHGAHGYLIHQFHSSYTNHRSDRYGVDKARFGVEIIKRAKKVMPESMPLIFRVSAIEYVDGGYGLDYSTELCREYQKAGVDIFHVSSGGEGPIGSAGKPDAGPGYQVDFATHIRKALNCPVIAVGRLENPQLAAQVIQEDKADLVAIGREMLRSPYWANEASIALGKGPLTPKAYERGYISR
jgi:NADPH2 dehydrogenase